MNKRRWIWVGIAFTVFLVSFFVGGPALEVLMESHQPYLLVDPDVRAETGCEYDYITYIPVEITGRDISEGIVFPVSDIPIEYTEYVHYPASWGNPFNPFNPANKFARSLDLYLRILLGIVCVAFIAYLLVLWRRGKLRKLRDKMRE